ncbi:uncharacterized protein LOC133195924 [Saccostrea echinata]|uniref:uncharacterized protein LOC133195924 n=1 Tax=Saccostrea echinata TaxID=191078 RepID=UPI002A81C0F5|nr:uncharacterized protein LOC133195924 [Saccostrea echinata]
MWWIVQGITSFFYYSILDFVFFIIVDAFAKFTIGDTNSKTVQEKRLIWFWESVVLFILSFIIYLCDHVPYLLITLSVVTFGYTQFGVSFNIYRWWRQMKTRWEEHQHHQDSMTRLQVQLAMHQQQQQQQEALQQMMAFNHQPQHPVQQPGQQNIFNATPANKPKAGQEERGIYKSIWSKTPKIQLSSLFKRAQAENNEEKAANPNSSPPPPIKKQEFSFMPSLRAKSSFAGGQHLATMKDDSPPAKPSWYGDNLSRKPLRSGRLMPYSPASRPQNDSLRSRIMSKFGFGSSESTPAGLRNEGQNLCFINAVIQCLARTPGLVSELENEAAYKDSDCSMAESLLLSTLSELMHSCNMNEKPLLDPIAFRQAASSLNPNLVAPPTQRQSQQDAAEFFMWLVESLHSIINRNRKTRSNDRPAPRESKRLKVMKFIYGDLTPAKVSDLKKACKEEINAAHGLLNDSYAESVQRLSDLEWISYKEENSSVVDNLLTGQLVIAYHCLADNHISVNMQTFSILPVPIEAPRQVNGLVHLSDCFTKFCNIEHLVGQDGLECSFCNAQRARQLEQVRTPVSTPYLRNNYNFRTPNGRTALSSADSAVSGVGSPLATNFMSPIPGSRDMLSDSGFQDNVFKTSTPISDNQIPLPQRLRDAQRRCSLRQLPDCLVIQLMRFSFNPYTRQTNKVHAPVSIPLSNLDLTEVMFDTIANREDLAEEEAIYKYDLYGLCCHLGGDSANYGHYVSYCLHSDSKWYRFDDERVIEVDMEYELTTHEIRQNAYILFYKKQGMSV